MYIFAFYIFFILFISTGGLQRYLDPVSRAYQCSISINIISTKTSVQSAYRDNYSAHKFTFWRVIDLHM